MPDPNNTANQPTEKRQLHPQVTIWLRWGAIVIALLLLVGWVRPYLTDFMALLRNQDALSSYVQQYGPWGWTILTLLQFLQILVAFIPGHVLCVAAGYLYGFWPAFAFNMAVTVGFSMFCFFLGRWAGRPVVTHLVREEILDRWDSAAERYGFAFFLTTFLLPIFATDAMNYVAGLSSISGRRFFLANLLGRIPGMLILSLTGAYGVQLLFLLRSPWAWAAILLGSLGLFLVWRHAFRDVVEQRFMEEERDGADSK